MYYNDAIGHIVPFSATTWPYQFDFIGELSRDKMQNEWVSDEVVSEWVRA